MNRIDYQWPSSLIDNTKNNTDFVENKSVEDLIKKIESFFNQFYDCHVCLMPSGRSSISLLLRYLNFDRSKTVYIPKWASNCLYSCIGNYSNISTDFLNPDLILAVNKWGYRYYLHKDYPSKIIIDDSVDTIHLNGSNIFQNNCIASIISLPKIIGSYSGGLILTKDKSLSDYIRRLQFSNIELGLVQSKRKRQVAQSSWEYYEHKNTSLDLNALCNITNNLSNLQLNINLISHRREVILKKFREISIDSKRLGPILAFPKSKYKIIRNKDSFMSRQFNYELEIDRLSCFESSYLLPVHFKISDEFFQLLFEAIVER